MNKSNQKEISNDKKDAVKLAKKLDAKLIITVNNPLSDYTHIENGKNGKKHGKNACYEVNISFV